MKRYLVYYRSEYPHPEEILQDASLRIPEENRRRFEAQWNDSERAESLIEGDEYGDYWSGDADGEIEAPYCISGTWCPKCNQIMFRHRVWPFFCPPTMQSYVENTKFDSYEDFRNKIAHIEVSIQRSRDPHCTLFPGDIFLPLIWKDPLRIYQREYFNLANPYGVLFVVSERIAERIRRLKMNSTELHPLQIESRFHENGPMPFYAVHRPVLFTDEPILKNREDHLCTFCHSRLKKETKEEMIQRNILHSRMRKKKILPREYLPDCEITCGFIYQGHLFSERAFSIFEGIDLSYAKVEEIEIVDDADLYKPKK